MAESSINDIKARIKSVKSTMQITKAMELVASSKLKRAKERAELSRAYGDLLSVAIKAISGTDEVKDHPFCTASEGKTLFIVIAGDRGLAGGYNSNIFKLCKSVGSENDIFLPIGKKAWEYFSIRELKLFTDIPQYAADVGVGTAMSIGKRVANAFLDGKISKVTVIYTRFASMISQVPTHSDLLPVECIEDGKPDAIYDTDPEEILFSLIPEYLGGMIYTAVCESVASECAARRSAMNSANKNAEEIIDGLSLKFNRARQAAITQEISEIVSGANALN